MAQMDTILRYIRIFSELSGQIRYANQKRILIEMALIKLCRPAMETKEDALLDRIRQVEEKVENAVILPEGMNLENLYTGAAAGDKMPQKRSKPEMPKAIPEDIKKVVANWPTIVGNAENPMKMYLKGAKLSM